MTSLAIRRVILEQSKRAHEGHIGSNLSIADIVAALYGQVLRLPAQYEDRDRFVLSKGHAALALYSALFLKGILSEEQINSFCMDGSLLGVHPEHTLKGVDFSTGSLGHGLSIGAGAALAAKLQKSSRRVFVLLSDAECNEGSIWEAAMFAAHHRLSNLIAIVDANKQQALGYTDDILRLSPMIKLWQAHGWDAVEIDGHDVPALAGAMNKPAPQGSAPRVLIANTVFGKGVSYMEGKIKWHYWPMSDEEYRQALADIEVRS
ncbi:MAG: transketolase [Candidatus Omnitrophica bacterium]|nr:transketolase [Candidatus Omnitrophota bacterium]